MGIGTWIFAGVAVGGTVLYFRAQRAAPSEKDVCDRIAELNPDAGKACKLAKGLLDALETDSRSDKEQKNNALNGEVELRAHASMPIVKSGAPHQVASPRSFGGADFTQLGDQGYAISPDARVLQYKNGCVPYKAAHGWQACAEGTHDMSPLTRKPQVLSGELWDEKEEFGHRDPTTLPHKTSAGPFPLPVPAGSSGWWHMGQPVVCPAGYGITTSGVRDHRPGASPCRPLDSDADDPIFPPPDPTRVCNPGETYTVRIDHRTNPATRKYTPCRPANTSGTITIGAHADEKD